MKFSWANVNKIEEANVVLLGVPDEKGSQSSRKGAEKAPDAIREISLSREVFERSSHKTHALPNICPINKNIFDKGNIKRKKVADFIESVVKKEQVPFVMGGDHTITAEILKGIDKLEKDVSVVYFDAHPDFICSPKKFFEPVVCDMEAYRNISFSTSVEIGTRDPTPHELQDVRKEHIKVITPFDLTEQGVQKIFNQVRRTVGDNIYISVDMDVVDPCLAPGVSTPVPGGITSSQLIHLLKLLAELDVVGFDIMEVNPHFDVQETTTHLAARVIMETISSIKTNHNSKTAKEEPTETEE